MRDRLTGAIHLTCYASSANFQIFNAEFRRCVKRNDFDFDSIWRVKLRQASWKISNEADEIKRKVLEFSRDFFQDACPDARSYDRVSSGSSFRVKDLKAGRSMKFGHVGSWTLNRRLSKSGGRVPNEHIASGFSHARRGRSAGAINVKTFTFDSWESNQKVAVPRA